MAWLQFIGGLVILVLAADRFVLAAARISRAWGMSPILVGALVVGMGTSAPELLVSTLAAGRGELDLAVGNVVGSNVANVTLVLGMTAVIAPVSGSTRILQREGIMMMLAVIGLSAAVFDLDLRRYEGVALAASMVVATALIVRWAKKDKAAGLLDDDEEYEHVRPGIELTLGLASLGATLVGAELLVRGGVALAEQFGLGSAFVGMTLVAVGTSLPELATSIAGIRRKQHDLVIGNVLGSNLFNAFAVAGVSAVIAPGPVDAGFRSGSIVMVVCAAVAGFLAFTGREVVRWEGSLLLTGFFGFVYLTYIQ